MPLVSRRYAELLERELERERAMHAQTVSDLARQREVNERTISDALTATGIPSPYAAPRQGTPARPIGHRSAEKILRAIEQSEREKARATEKVNGTDAADDAATAAA